MVELDKDLYEQWMLGAFTKCVLQAKNKNQLMKAVTIAEELGMKEGEDGIGRTLTCIGFKPMDSEVIDQIGKKYHLWT